MPTVIHHIPTGRLLSPRFLDALHFAVRERQDRGCQVWLAAGAGPVLYPRSGGYRFAGLEGGVFVFRTGAGGADLRRLPVAATPPRKQRAAA